ncbi:hypothetical protein GCM10009795_013720 [Nocardioides hankookensis]|uniref:Uncharacterized protein n=1 Tax=Nocardioides hankookensis TaxID=443157 RepID=A0ABW1LK88_9ACTN
MSDKDSAAGSANSKPPQSDEGNEFALFVSDELDFEMRRADRAEAQGQRLLTASSTLVTLAFAGSALVTSRSGFEPPRMSLWAMVPATLFLLAGAGLGLRGSRVTTIQRASIALLRRWDTEPPTMWKATSVGARTAITAAKITALDSLRQANNAKMKWVIWGGRAQGAGLVFLTLASLAILLHAAKS